MKEKIRVSRIYSGERELIATVGESVDKQSNDKKLWPTN